MFYLQDAVDCPEYLVHPNVLKEYVVKPSNALIVGWLVTNVLSLLLVGSTELQRCMDSSWCCTSRSIRLPQHT
jgi:hypothetical protein